MSPIIKFIKAELPVVENLSIYGLSRKNLFISIKTFLSSSSQRTNPSVPMGRWAIDTKTKAIKNTSVYYD